MKRLIIFDWDDVITLGSKEGCIRCLHDTLVDLGVILDPEEEHRRILSTWSQPHELELGNLLREKPELLVKACAMYEEKFFGTTFLDCLSLVHGANETLHALGDSYTLAVATGAHPIMLQERVIPKFSIPNVFATIISGYEITDPANQKPAPYMIEEIMRRVGITDPEEVVMVGDAASDVAMARAAGVTPIVVLTGHLSRKEAEDLAVEHIIEDMTQLPAILEKI